MKVLVAMPNADTRVYLEGLNGYKNEKCEPKIEDDLAVFRLSLIDFYDCGTIRVVNKLTVSSEGRLIHFTSSLSHNGSDRFLNAMFFIFVGKENLLP